MSSDWGGSISSRLAAWRRVGHCSRSVFKSRGVSLRISTREIPSPSPVLDGLEAMFFSDLHWNRGSSKIAGAVADFVNPREPDVIIFGGDVSTYLCFLDEAMSFLGSLRAKARKLAVLGNWDRRWRRWMPFGQWREFYRRAGFDLLVNEWAVLDGLLVYGFDDNKLGQPFLEKPPVEDGFRLAVSHNPDTVPESDPVEMDKFRLTLCGHTHGGQIRAPMIGALKTSSKYWKKFEYGLYENRDSGGSLIVSAGLGETLLPLRLFCPPEIVALKFVGGQNFPK